MKSILKTVAERLKSPVVIIQLISIVGAAVVLLVPDTGAFVDTCVTALAAVINAFAGLNNPADKNNF